ncbi:MAG TPA: hypothetical protein VNI60_11970 [Pyrinomonadaceae bacterium]|nr:hypothetical protein [Pyrinomonadaceae bacterium]
MENHPYKKFQNTKVWQVVEQSIFDLEENQDLKLLTIKEYIIGFICKKLDDNKLLKNTTKTENGNS